MGENKTYLKPAPSGFLSCHMSHGNSGLIFQEAFNGNLSFGGWGGSTTKSADLHVHGDCDQYVQNSTLENGC